MTVTIACACGDRREDHEHYHAATYCGRCPCPRWRPRIRITRKEPRWAT